MTRSRTDRAAATLLRGVAAEARPGQEELLRAILDRLRDTVPELYADDDVAHDLEVAARANVERVRQLLASPAGTPLADGLPIEAADLLESTIQHGIPLISLLEAYRAAHGLALDWWQRRLERSGSRGTVAAVHLLTERIGAYIDTASAQIRASYERQRAAMDASPDGRRAHLIRRLLAGEPLDADAASRTLNHPLRANHIALVLWREEPAVEPVPFARPLGELAAALGRVRTLSLPETRRRTYAWLSSSSPLEPARLREVSTAPGILVVTSGMHAGPDGFVQAHLDAVRTAAAVRGQAPPGGVVSYERLELLALVSHDPAARDRFVRRLLGPLAAPDPSAARSRETLATFLACGESPTRTAAALGVHRNTVGYRLASLAAVLEPDAAADASSRARHRLELALALHIVEHAGALTA